MYYFDINYPIVRMVAIMMKFLDIKINIFPKVEVNMSKNTKVIIIFIFLKMLIIPMIAIR